MASLEHLHNIRSYELNRALPYFPTSVKILEIGAGTGWQAKKLAELGFHVEAIELENSLFVQLAENRVWTVTEYNGYKIPFQNQSFDLVFSSNVLEHIPHIEEFQKEIQRVLKDKGMAIHILPTASWRFWSSITHYPFVMIRNFNKLMGINKKQRQLKKLENKSFTSLQPEVEATRKGRYSKFNAFFTKLMKAIIPDRHGEKGNFLTEFYYFSHFRWLKLFHKTGWKLITYYPTKLFYTGYSIIDLNLNMNIRIKLSHIFGSSCLIYILKKDIK